ncbi:MAG: DNA primase [Deltaproteobacteria bacterium]
MAGLIDESVLEQILSRVDIVEVVSEHLPLKRSGRNFKACCPFHHEKTASFMVSPDKQIYHCFGCGAGGNAFNFLMQYERLEFPEAVDRLARKAGVVIPEKHRQGTNGQSALLHKALELASGYFQERLFAPEGKQARAYLAKRGVLPDTARLFKLGFATDQWDGLIRYLRSKDVTLAVMEKAGLVLPKDNGGYYDRFRGRLTFTITNMKSEVVGFGARILGKGEPKYLNSPETQVYVKGKNLFNLNLAKEELRNTDSLVLVEGYMDCLIPYQAGIRNICASCGTALTSDQARLIRRFTENVVVLYDGDSAGQTATLRSLDIFIEEKMNVRIAALPEGEDPDTFVRKNGADALKTLIAGAEDLFDYKLRLLRLRHDEKKPEGLRKITAELLPTIKKIPDAVLIGDYIKKLAERLKSSEEALYAELRKVKEETPYAYRGMEPAVRQTAGVNPTEMLFVKLMMEETKLISRIRGSVDPGDFQDSRTQHLVSMMFDLVSQGKDPKANLLVNDPAISSLIRESMDEEKTPPVPEDENEKDRTLHDCIERIKKNSRTLKCRRLQEAIRQAETDHDERRKTDLMVEFNKLIKTR